MGLGSGRNGGRVVTGMRGRLTGFRGVTGTASGLADGGAVAAVGCFAGGGNGNGATCISGAT